MGATASHTAFLSWNMDVHSNCEAGVITKTIGCQTAQGLFKITLREEVAKMNELTGTITCLLGFRQEWQIRTWWKVGRYRGVGFRRVGLPSDGGAIVQGLHEGLHNQTNVLEDSMAVVEHKDNDKAAGLEIAESSILCSQQAYKTYKNSTAVFFP